MNEAWKKDFLRLCHLIEHLPDFPRRAHCRREWVEHQRVHRGLAVFIEHPLHHEIVDHHMGAIERGKLCGQPSEVDWPHSIPIDQAGYFDTAALG